MGAIIICRRIILQAYKNKTLFILICVPFISFLIAVLLSIPSETSIRIGILDEDNSELSALFIRMIEKNRSFEINADISDVSDMQEKLRNQDIVIGMKINENLYNNIEIGGSVHLFQTFDIETFRLVELYINSSIENMLLIKKSTDTQNDLIYELEKYYQENFLELNILPNERARGLFSSTAFGFLTMFMLLVSVLSSKLIVDDRFNTTIRRIFISPIKKTSYLLAGLLSNFIFQTVQILVIVIICAIMNFQFTIPMYAVVVIFIIFAIFASFFGLFIGFISKSVNQMLIISQLFILPGMLLCGTFFEFSLMPDWLQRISFIFPQTWITQTSEHFYGSFYSPYFAAMFGYIAFLCLIAGIYLILIFKKKKVGSFY